MDSSSAPSEVVMLPREGSILNFGESPTFVLGRASAYRKAPVA